MNQNNLNWYRENGFPKALLSSVEETTNLVEKYYEMKFDDLFVSNIQNGDFEEYTSLWLFTEQDAVECKHFLNRFDIDIVKYKNNVCYINIIADNNAMISPEPTSTMRVVINLNNNLKCTFDAKGHNCQRLSKIAKRFLKEYKALNC